MRDYKKFILPLFGVILLLGVSFNSFAYDPGTGYEDFEGVMPNSYWSNIGDADTGCGESWWDDVWCRSSGGGWSAWCADMTSGTLCDQVPCDAAGNGRYDNDMDSTMTVEADYFGTSAGGTNRLRFSFWGNWEGGFDGPEIIIEGYVDEPLPGGQDNPECTPDALGMITESALSSWNDSAWHTLVVTLPASFDSCLYVRITFRFFSDGSVTYEGVYYDNIDFNASADTAIYPINGGFTGTCVVPCPCSSLPDCCFGDSLSLTGPGDDYIGSLTAGDAQDASSRYFDDIEFCGTSGQNVTIDMYSTDFDTYLVLYPPDSCTTAATSDDDGGWGVNSRISFTLNQTGTWTIKATSFSPDTLGSYTVWLDGVVICYTSGDCDDGNVCTDDTCNMGGYPYSSCSYNNNANPCNDGNACTVGDTCGGGSCQAGSLLTCDDGNICTDDSCNPATGCVYTNNANHCNDSNACTVGDTCGGGSCQAGSPLTCNDGNICTDDSCNPATGCVYTNNTDPCDDGLWCTVNDICSGGSCNGSTRNCADVISCTSDSCDDTIDQCVNTPNDSLCDDGNVCTDDICDPVLGCQNPPTPAGTPCESGYECDGNGNCEEPPPPPPDEDGCGCNSIGSNRPVSGNKVISWLFPFALIGFVLLVLKRNSKTLKKNK